MNLTNTKDGSEMESETAEITQAVSDSGSGNACTQSPRGPARPVSPQKLAANRENAKHSTGPKTMEGKQRSRNNAYRHGFFSSQSIDRLTDGMELGEPYITLIDGIREYFKPVGFVEELLTDKVVSECVRLRRLLAYESKIVAGLGAFHLQGVDRILRFLSAGNRQLFQTIHELERLQEKRKADPNSAHSSDRETNDEGMGPVTAPDSQDCGRQGGVEGADIPAPNNGNQPVAVGGESTLSGDCGRPLKSQPPNGRRSSGWPPGTFRNEPTRVGKPGWRRGASGVAPSRGLSSRHSFASGRPSTCRARGTRTRKCWNEPNFYRVGDAVRSTYTCVRSLHLSAKRSGRAAK